MLFSLSYLYRSPCLEVMTTFWTTVCSMPCLLACCFVCCCVWSDVSFSGFDPSFGKFSSLSPNSASDHCFAKFSFKVCDMESTAFGSTLFTAISILFSSSFSSLSRFDSSWASCGDFDLSSLFTRFFSCLVLIGFAHESQAQCTSCLFTPACSFLLILAQFAQNHLSQKAHW